MSLPTLPNRFPLFGALFRFLFREHTSLYHMFNGWLHYMKNVPTFKTHIPGAGSVIVTKNREWIEELNEKTCFHLVTTSLAETGSVIFANQESEWAPQRERLTIPWHLQHVHEYSHIQSTIFAKYLERWNSDKEWNRVYENIHLMMLDAMFSSTYPIHFSEEQVKDLYKSSCELDTLLDKRSKNLFTFNRNRIIEWYQKTRDMLIQDAFDAEIMKEQIQAFHVIDLMIGVKNMTYVLTQICFFLARFPQWQYILRAELMDRPIHTYTDYLECIQTRAFVFECLRLKPPTPLLASTSNTEMVLDGHRFPPGTIFIKLLENSIRENDFNSTFPIKTFAPTRFFTNQGTIKDEAEPWMSMVYGSGPRKCPGRFLANMSTALFIQHLLRLVQVQLPSPSVDPEESFIGVVNIIVNHPQLLFIRLTPSADV